MGLWAEFLERQQEARALHVGGETSAGSNEERRELHVGAHKRFIPQTLESGQVAADVEERKRRIKECTDAGVKKGLEAAALWGGLALVGTLAAVRFSPAFAHNFNYTARALIPSASMAGAYFVVSESTILKCLYEDLE